MRHLGTGGLYFLTALIFGIGTLPAAAGPVYKWVDEHGQVHYSDHPGAADARRVPLPAPPPPDTDAARRRTKELKLLHVFDEERAEHRATAAKAAKARRQRLRKCEAAKKRQSGYEHARYLYVKNKDGGRRILNDREQRQALERAAAAVRHWCTTR